MRNIIPFKIVTLLCAYNLIGRYLHGPDWSGEEVAAIKLGQRSHFSRDIRLRGLEALNLLKELVSNGLLNPIYTDQAGLRVPYHGAVGYWITDIFPDPLGAGEGMIELNDQDIYPCVIDISGFGRKFDDAARQVKNGPKARFGLFAQAVSEFFDTHPVTSENWEAWDFARRKLDKDDAWPKPTWGNELINRAREKQLTIDRSLSADRIPNGPQSIQSR